MKVDEAIDKYIAIRDAKAELKERHKQELAKYNEALAKIESALLKHFQKTGTKSTKTSESKATAFTATRTSDTVKDRAAFLAYIKKSGNYDLLDARVTKTALDQFVEDNKGELPPGVNRITEITLNVRRGK